MKGFDESGHKSGHDYYEIGLEGCNDLGIGPMGRRGDRYMLISGCIDFHDASLIAAAPDLYEALAAEVAVRLPKEGVGDYQCGNGYDIGDDECNCDDCTRHRTSIAVLAKARGEA